MATTPIHPALRETIDKLVRLDAARQATGRDGGPEVSDDDFLKPDAVEALLSAQSKDDLICIKALMSFGRDDLFPTFAEALQHAQRSYNEDTAQYLAGKDLADDLPAGLAKLGV